MAKCPGESESTVVGIRVSPGLGVGVGHYMRMQVLAGEFGRRGNGLIFLVDSSPDCAGLPQCAPIVEVDWDIASVLPFR